jgi:2'-5' RNA ligase
VRVFVAIDIPVPVRAKIDAFIARVRPACPRARWVRIEGVHVTLKFIGEIALDHIDLIKSALSTLAAPAAIKMNFRNVGFFPNERRPRVFWAGIEAGAGLSGLTAGIEAAFEPLGIAREQRAFMPHLTLARFDDPLGVDKLRAAIANVASLEFGGAFADEFHLYQSVLKRGGAEYTRLASFPLSGAALR